MKSSRKDRAEGTFHKVKGKVKEIAGELSDNPKLEAEGRDEKKAQTKRAKTVKRAAKQAATDNLGATDAPRSPESNADNPNCS